MARRHGGTLSVTELAVRHSNRRWMSLVVVPAALIGVASLIAAVVASQQPPSAVRPASVPSGYRAVSDGVFAYSVPSGWAESIAYSDDVGDLDHQGSTGWAAEHLGPSSAAPGPGSRPPRSFQAFGESQPLPYHLGPPTPVHVSGATVAYRYVLTRPDGFEAAAVDAWRQSSGAQLWLLVHAPPATTAAVLASLRA